MKTAVIILSLCLTLALASVIFMVAYTAGTETYMADHQRRIASKFEHALILANLQLIGLPKTAAEEKIRSSYPNKRLFEKEGCLVFGQVCVRLDEKNVVVEISDPTENDDEGT